HPDKLNAIVHEDRRQLALARPHEDDRIVRFVSSLDEAAIAAAIRLFLADQHVLIEGAAGVAVAAVQALAPALRGQRVGVIICGGNISLTALRDLL
ncbi:MAG TPA: hypothetical protein PKC19_02455, partial [Roseiflexaceae bacterium]|nr:hypothetical protein [Roseiflexaceae bacterium]